MRIRGLARLLAGVALVLTRPGPARADDSWADIEGRIQYAFYTEDARSLTALGSDLAAMNPQRGRDYYRALVSWRLALLLASHDRRGAARAVQQCVDSLDGALEAAPADAEYLALQAGCLDQRARLATVDMSFAAARGRAQLQRALTLAPANPRVQLLNARLDYEHSGADRLRALGELQRAVAAFERERQAAVQLPGWGAPDAYADLARSCLDRGDAVAARSALEHALLLVPEFAYAQRLMARITSG